LTPGGFAAAYGINDTGRIVGSAENSDGLWQAVRWQRDVASGSLTGPFVLPGVPAGWEAEAYAVNADDTIAGELIDGEGISHAVIWQLNGASYVRVDLTGFAAFAHSLALDLNSPAVGDPLVVAGEVGDDGLSALTQAVQWSVDMTTVPATVTASANLGVAGKSSSAAAVNAAGRTAGWEESATGISQAATWDGLSPAAILTASDSQAFDINVNNLVVGRSGELGFVKLAN